METRLMDTFLERGRDLYLIKKNSQYRSNDSVHTSIFLVNFLSFYESELPTQESSYKDVKNFFKNNYFNATYLNERMPSEQKIKLDDIDSFQIITLEELIEDVFGRQRGDSLQSYIALKMDYRQILMNLLQVGLSDKKDELWSYRDTIIKYLEELKSVYYDKTQTL